jgi:hypothetical protein
VAYTWDDTNVYFFDSGQDGATILLLGGSHPNEPVGSLAASVLVENAKAEVGRLIVIPHINRSGSTGTQPGGAYPLYYHIKTNWGAKQYRMGDRVINPLDQWPDPDVYFHYPTGQMLSNVDIRNVNRAWPGRPNGTLAEKTTHAAMRLMEKEKVDIAIDLHGAELLYPVTNCIVAPDSAAMIATMAAINLTATDFEIHVEPSPPGFRGLTHREIGDHSKTLPFLFETPEPFLDQPTGPKTEALELEGKDEFLLAAGRRGLLFTDYDENGKPMKLRVGRHLQTLQRIAKEWSDINPGKPVRIGAPTFADLMKYDVGHFLHDPAQANPEDVYYE